MVLDGTKFILVDRGQSKCEKVLNNKNVILCFKAENETRPCLKTVSMLCIVVDPDFGSLLWSTKPTLGSLKETSWFFISSSSSGDNIGSLA